LHEEAICGKVSPSEKEAIMKRLPFFFVAFLAVAVPAILDAGPIIIDFEGLPDSTILTSQYSGVAFSNAIILAAGISLNEFEFPPRSGVNVASDNNGPMSIIFLTPALNFSGFFTYGEQLTLTAFDTLNNPVVTVHSLFSNNEALSGVSGSHPNELLSAAFAGGVFRVTILGDPVGGSFALDDVTITSTVPEPASILLLLAGVVALIGRNCWKALSRSLR
jgi:hypothetical protein